MKLFGFHLFPALFIPAILVVADDRGSIGRRLKPNGKKSKKGEEPSSSLVRQFPEGDGNAGVPVMNIEDRADLGLDVDGAATEEPWRDVHRGFFAARQFQVSIMNDHIISNQTWSHRPRRHTFNNTRHTARY
jgi:hypothetical protein